MYKLRAAICCILLALGGFSGPLHAFESSNWQLTAYAARYSPERMIDILRAGPRFDERRAYISALAMGYEVGRTGDYLHWELEGQLVQHHRYQDHHEFNALVIARWTRFPWDHRVRTSIAFGEGLSYASAVPPIEPRGDRDGGESARLLNYLLVELELGLPHSPQWGLVARLHHRSGVFGLYNGVNGGSNYIGGGLRYRF